MTQPDASRMRDLRNIMTTTSDKPQLSIGAKVYCLVNKGRELDVRSSG